jgi:energy-coupling factor transporter ATP-binding protein EcfA2
VSGVRWHERVFVCGYTGSGKSGLLNHLFSGLRNQKLLLDTKPEFRIPGVEPVRSVDEIDWSAPVIHFVEADQDLDEIDRLFHVAGRRRNLTICAHELADLCDDQPGRTPKYVRRWLRVGNIFGNGLLGASQRPVCMPRQARTEAQHVFAMVPALDDEDHAIVAKLAQTNRNDLYRQLEEAAELSPTGRHSFVWIDRVAGHVTLSEPLPEHLRRQCIVKQRALGAA